MSAAPAAASTPAPVFSAGPGERVVLVSDLHLGDHDPATAQAFLQWIGGALSGATHGVLLGDLFEAWVGDDCDDPLAASFAAVLARSARAPVGPQLWLARGNRDFLLDAGPDGVPAFSGRCGARLLADPCVAQLGATRVALLHGDQLCTDDHAYQAFRAQVRDPGWQRSALALPLPARLARARTVRARSREATAAKDEAIMDANAAEVQAVLSALGATAMVHGHTHRPACHRPASATAAPGTLRWVLPDWDAAALRGGGLAVDVLEDGSLRWSPIGPWGPWEQVRPRVGGRGGAGGATPPAG